jgi:hypothetical protein
MFASQKHTWQKEPMKNRIRNLSLALVGLAFPLLSSQLSTAHAQGSLTPPGAPGPTMKTLEQIEPRTSLAAGTNVTHSIGTPGSYYLLGNVRQINIDADNVTLDLNGFSVVVGYDGDGIGIRPGVNRGNVVIRNGSVVGPGVWTNSGPDVWNGTLQGSTRYGIVTWGRTAGTDTPRCVRLENITVRGFFRGVAFSGGSEFDGRRHQIQRCTVFDCGIGIRTDNSNLSDVSVQTCTDKGIEGSLCNLQNVLVERCGGTGISGNHCTLRDAVARFCGGDGIVATSCNIDGTLVSASAIGLNASLSTLRNVTSRDNRSSGISGDGLTIDGAVVHANGAHGIIAPGSTVRGARASNNAGAGVWCEDSSINQCMIYNNGADGIRGVRSTINACRSFNNDANKTDGYTASDIYWDAGRQQANVAGTYYPTAPAP